MDSRSRLLVDKVIKEATIPGNNCCHAGIPGLTQNCGFPHIWEIDFVQNTLFFENEELQTIFEKVENCNEDCIVAHRKYNENKCLKRQKYSPVKSLLVLFKVKIK